MGLDIRLPIGFLFTLVGLVLVVYGVFADSAIYARSLGYNVNRWWGLVLLVFGVLTLHFGRKGTSAMRTAATEPEGRATEAREHQTGLESN